jgi:nucleoporin GLE1
VLRRLLNNLPSNRLTATALEAFLKVAGYKMFNTFRGQFGKVLQYIEATVLTDLVKHGDVETHAVQARLESYLTSRDFQIEPEGRHLPQHDYSSEIRA